MIARNKNMKLSSSFNYGVHILNYLNAIILGDNYLSYITKTYVTLYTDWKIQ